MASGIYAKNYVRKWYKDFPKSDLFQALDPVFQKNAKWTVEFFAEMMADYMDDPPLSWNGKDTKELVVNIIPRKSIFERKIYEGFCPILRAFFEYLGRDFIEEKWSRELINALRGKDSLLLQNARSVIKSENSPLDEGDDTEDSDVDNIFLRLILSRVLSQQQKDLTPLEIDNIISKLKTNQDWSCNYCHQPIEIGDAFIISPTGVLHFNDNCARTNRFEKNGIHFVRSNSDQDKIKK